MGWTRTILGKDGQPTQEHIKLVRTPTGDGSDVIYMPPNPIDGQTCSYANLSSDASPVTVDGNGQQMVDYVSETLQPFIQVAGSWLDVIWYFADPDGDGNGAWLIDGYESNVVGGLFVNNGTPAIGLTDTLIPLQAAAVNPPYFTQYWSIQGGELQYEGINGIRWELQWDHNVAMTMGNNTEYQVASGIKLSSGTGQILTIEQTFPFQSSRVGVFGITLSGGALIIPVKGDLYQLYARDDTTGTPGTSLNSDGALVSLES